MELGDLTEEARITIINAFRGYSPQTLVDRFGFSPNFVRQWLPLDGPSGTIYKEDVVNHPLHYTSGNGPECIEAIEGSMTPEEFIGYLKGNIMKYLWRYRDKEKPLQDLKKGQWYLNLLIDRVEKIEEEI